MKEKMNTKKGEGKQPRKGKCIKKRGKKGGKGKKVRGKNENKNKKDDARNKPKKVNIYKNGLNANKNWIKKKEREKMEYE